MTENVLGLGHQKSVRNVVAVAALELQKNYGLPRKVAARAPGIEVVAERSDFNGDFETFVLRLRVTGPTLDALRAVAAEYTDVCAMNEEGGWQVLVCPPMGAAPSERAKEAVDKLTAGVALPEVWRIRGDNYRIDHVSVEMLFQAMIQYKASDVHLSPGQPPIFRIDNETHRSDLLGPLSAAQILALVREVCSDQEWATYQEKKQASFNFHQVGLGYSRVSAFIKAGAPHLTFRFLPEVIPSFEDLNVPRETMIELASLHHGLVLVTGMTGSGKTTTVAALVDWINSNNTLHILTIENPVEYVHVNKKSLISQRGLGVDVNSFNDAVTGALRHDPDVIVIGEMRDPDTIRSAINAAATGHLVISTLHSNTAAEVVNRIVSFFDPVERDLVRLQLRDCLRCVICQRLVPMVGGGRLPALEFMFNDIKPISDGVIAGDTDAIRVGMQQTISHSFLFEEYLHQLYKAGKISLENAQAYSTEVSMFNQMNMGTYSVPRLESLKEAREAGRHRA
ncbi:MAG: PilT/PilU family type 4a pilus ATPase [Candidatus Hydrogenedentes bacterium]|nr:PilT/PilU family type 4a pilus ATPase [Candidatus Hydrogenedentota bacterium]